MSSFLKIALTNGNFLNFINLKVSSAYVPNSLFQNNKIVFDIQFFISITTPNKQINHCEKRQNNPAIRNIFAKIKRHQSNKCRNTQPKKFKQQNTFMWFVSV